MSLVITLCVREGIVMASDSRMTLNATRQEADKQIVQLAVGQSDSNYKTFLAPCKVGISTFGAADVQGTPIAGYIESFMNEKLVDNSFEVDQIPPMILEYFRNLPGPPETGFFVAGYKTIEKTSEQQLWEVFTKENKIARLNKPGRQGASWMGESDILIRLLQPVYLKDESGNFQPVSHHQIQWGFFTLQDAIDYAIFSIKVTIDAMRFHPRPKTVGGPIDVLVIKPNEAFWVQKKGLHG